MKPGPGRMSGITLASSSAHRGSFDDETSIGLFQLKPDHCVIEDIYAYTVGIACAKLRSGLPGGR